MRRKEREVTDQKKLLEIIEACHCCRVGFACEGQVYIVPVNFGYVCEDGKYTLYFHGAGEGRKMELVRENPVAGFEMDTGYELKTAASACGYSAYFQSITGQGRVSIVNDMEEKRKGLCAVMKHETGKADWEFQEKMLDVVCVWKLEVSGLTGRTGIRY
ncbi:pyridoxamine 5'-phosphate oxidase family protein [Lachnospiraceae bacterium 48-42]